MKNMLKFYIGWNHNVKSELFLQSQHLNHTLYNLCIFLSLVMKILNTVGLRFVFTIGTHSPKMQPIHWFAKCCIHVTSTCPEPTDCTIQLRLVATLTFFFNAPFQRQRTWQGQVCQAEVKKLADRDVADHDTRDWQMCVYSVFCCIGLHVNYPYIKTINKPLHPTLVPLCKLQSLSVSIILSNMQQN